MRRDILLVDDDALMRRSLAFHLEQAGYHVRTAASAEAALETLEQAPADLVVLDINLPGMDGLDALREIKRRRDVPVIFLTARRRELDEVVGLEMGADDYVTKPFDVDVLLAHVKTVLRRAASAPTGEAPAGPLTVGDVTVDPGSHTVTRAGAAIELSPREFHLLLALARHADKVVPTEDLLAQVWGAEFAGQPQVVYVHIRWLRQKLEENPNQPELILTVRGVGYKIVTPTEADG